MADLSFCCEGMEIETFDTLEEAKESYDYEIENDYSSALIKYTVIKNFEREEDKI